MTNRDLRLLSSVIENIEEMVPKFLAGANVESGRNIAHPVDDIIVNKLKQFQFREEDDDYRIFVYVNEIKEIWKLIIEKSIKCLRFFDKREPYLENKSKSPVAYGVNELSDYFEKYTQFENMLYGGGKYYRDHVVHVFRVWLLGIDCLLDNEAEYLKRIYIQEGVVVNCLEKISIWSMIALTHDLGYPLEKSQEIIEKTKDMMKSFVSNPSVSMNLSFDGTQNNMNDFVVRFISSKMHKLDRNCPKAETETKYEKPFVARLQSKYYYKFQKSLGGYNHGILSAIIIYKMLKYFLESDFSINEDYKFDEEEARQFYMRREILRAIASHTCHDVYHLDMLNFAFLLIIADDAQEWGRKRISELYVNQKSNYEFDSITPTFDVKESTYKSVYGEKTIKIHRFTMKEQFTFPKDELENLKGILQKLMRQSIGYQEIFRDGQDTAKRNFVFEKYCNITYEGRRAVEFRVCFIISNEEKPSFEVTVSSLNKNSVSKIYNEDFLRPIYRDYKVTLLDKNKSETEAKYGITSEEE